ncbi:2-amino-4-hydroxy-6-hydroxymethyldihydropteridine diphosphokinase [Pseudomarimonas arenosa]|uniref:2-amino-4-hydroxy-6-hydroxymethyldihydropteridine pyrophosphokinase n=1 Tax=Pseudomarimonas arenosa TaxID=2774145 RepID=A0AAW3ZPG3_9GAMM|nr:2-amino-4-hydroxy-6-hydroxymethyldihydropteridine diphosphokinase [Pseudomarimonas arenosa]MBD8526529.1 2-amino-4-hydroxy-6-hydroxymethyldihydropteridine diphosphokinase [Pseudomarimonas arenosa]
MNPAPLCYIGLGSNLDQPIERVREAAVRLAALPEVEQFQLSPLYRSAPWGKLDQPDFINAVAVLRTSLPPVQLLLQLLSVERQMGRERGAERWGPRRIDLDLLHVEGVCLRTDPADSPALELPHPRIGERAFVLRPWCDLTEDLDLPGLGSLRQLANQVDCSSLSQL